MSQEYVELRGSAVVELRRVDHILTELARPTTLEEDSISPSTRAAMVQAGIIVSGRATRKDLIERLWARKRSLLRQVGSVANRDRPSLSLGVPIRRRTSQAGRVL